MTFAPASNLPAIALQPSNITVLIGQSATFSVTASGPAPLYYAWYSNGAPISGATSSSCTVANLQLANSGSLFSCLVTNAFGAVASSNATLSVQAGPIVQNGGFETGSFANWTATEKTGANISTNQPFVHSGLYGAQLGETGSPALNFLSQTLSTVPGQIYQISCWLYCDGTTPNEFSIGWNGSTLFDRLNMGDTGWTNIQVQGLASLTGTTLNLGFRNDNSFFGLDDIAVYQVPQFQKMTASNGAVSFTWIAQAGRTYQVQFSTNLAQNQWFNLGPALATTNSPVAGTDAASTSTARFYRVELLP